MLIAAGNLDPITGLAILAALSLGILPLVWLWLDELELRRHEAEHFDETVRRYGGRRGDEVLPRQRGDVIDTELDLEGAVRLLVDEHRPNPTDT